MPAALFKWPTIGFQVQYHSSAGPVAGRIESMGPTGDGDWSGTVNLSTTQGPVTGAEYSESPVVGRFSFPGGIEPQAGFAKQTTEFPPPGPGLGEDSIQKSKRA